MFSLYIITWQLRCLCHVLQLLTEELQALHVLLSKHLHLLILPLYLKMKNIYSAKMTMGGFEVSVNKGNWHVNALQLRLSFCSLFKMLSVTLNTSFSNIWSGSRLVSPKTCKSSRVSEDNSMIVSLAKSAARQNGRIKHQMTPHALKVLTSEL